MPDATAPAETAPAEPAPPVTEGAAIGSPAPAWENLAGTDDKTHSLKDLADAELVAVVFTCNHCPVAQAYEDRLVEFATDYEDKGVELVAINVSNLEADKMPAMKERATEKGYEFAYLYDPSMNIGKEFGAKVTPHAFVLDKSRNIAYMGAIDDNQDDSAVTKHYLRDAVDALLAGKTPEVATSQQFGCSIKYD
jgi:thiol-disulfide isomerase/thioredoxin